ncbi:general L-amino acid transport system substrate-binding protein [Arboricoccus pini]|uniref:General L-amino acid transport system substrate-binding protein n=1 Tax=Arboricoccus pini TaxID=1963835 RepID=A0A212QN51_9PROT|nr:amino acid ABC transporter substrate-binding protein [Arboricoccus pini]SNB60797.1 general L-amino acid transport system substrate-binding protein [Arboricoccus pini]
MRLKCLALAGAVAFVLGGTHLASAGPTLDAVKSRGAVKCGVNTGLAGFSLPDSQGKWTGIDADGCRVVAAAVLGDATKVQFVPLNAQQRFTALQSGEVDILYRNTTWTLTRDASQGLEFAGVNFYDGQGFLVPNSLGVKSALELDGATVCVQPGTTTELNLADYFRTHNMKLQTVVIEALDQLLQAFEQGRCQVYTTDKSGLAASLANDLSNPGDYTILPETISKEPLGPAVRRGDDEWFTIVKWSLYAQLEAEEAGITSKNVDEQKASSQSPTVQRLLGVQGDMGKQLGIDNAWAYNIVKQVGNYGEMYDRNVGPSTPLKLPRGQNALWNAGGLMYGIPVR